MHDKNADAYLLYYKTRHKHQLVLIVFMMSNNYQKKKKTQHD